MFVEWFMIAYLFIQGGGDPLSKIKIFKTQSECQIALEYEYDEVKKYMKQNPGDIVYYSLYCQEYKIKIK
jgi:hypothetical protein